MALRTRTTGSGSSACGRIQKIPRHEQFPQHVGDHDVDLPFPAGRPAAHQPQQFTVRLFDKTKIVKGEFRVSVAPDFLVPEFQTRPAEPETGDGQMPVGRRDVGPRLAHVHQPDLFAAPQRESPDLMLQFPFAGLDPEQMRARFFKTLMVVRLVQTAGTNGKKMPQQPPGNRRRINERSDCPRIRAVWPWSLFYQIAVPRMSTPPARHTFRV